MLCRFQQKNIITRKNVRKSSAFSGVTFAAMLSVGVLLSACDTSEKLTLEERMQRAVEQQYSGNMDAAVIELKNALRDYPDSADARFLLGQILIEEENGSGAEIELKKAIDAGKSEHLVLPHLASSWLLQRKFDEVLEKITLDPNDSLLDQITKRNLIGQALFGKYRLAEAAEQYDKVLEVAPENIIALVKRAEIYSIYQENDKVAEYIARAEAVVPDDRFLLQLKASHLWVTGKTPEAELVYQELTEKYPYIIANKVYLSWVQVLNGKTDVAGKRLDEIRKVYPGHPLVNYASAVWAMSLENYEAARTFANKVLEARSMDTRALFTTALASYALKDYEQSYTHIVKYVNLVPNDLEAKKLYAEVLLKLNKQDEAAEALGQALTDNVDDAKLLNMLARIELQRGRIEQARLYLERSLKTDAEQTTIQNRLGMLDVLSGDVEKGLQNMQVSLAGVSDKFAARLKLAQNLLSLRRFDEALEICEALHAEAPENISAATCIGYIKLETQKVSEAYGMFEQVLQQDSGNAVAAVVVANKYLSEDNIDEARSVLVTLLEKDPGNEAGLISLYQLEQHVGNKIQAEEYLLRAYKEHPNSMNVSVELARYYLLKNQPDKSLDVSKNVIALYPQNIYLLEVKGLAELRLKRTQAAIITFRNLKELAPNVLSPKAFLAEAYNQAQDWDSLEQIVDEMLDVMPNNRMALVYKAKVRGYKGDWDGADALLAPFVGEDSSDYEILSLRGRINMARGNYEKAVTFLEAAYSIKGSTSLVVDLANAYYAAKKGESAILLLEGWLKSHADDVLARWRLGDAYLGIEAYDKAEEQYKWLQANNPGNKVILNNLAWSQMKLNHLDDARKTIAKAREQDPLNPNILDTEGQILIEANMFEEAIRQLSKASDLAPQSLEIKYHLAKAYHESGDRDRAVALLQEIKADGRIFNGQIEAMELLENIEN